MNQNHFELFGLPATFAIDLAQLDARYRELQARVHPDRHAQGSSVEQRVAMQWATRANEAYRTLRTPLSRAQYLCELQGVALESESNTSMPSAFLMEQMAWREGLDEAREARNAAAIDAIEREVRGAREATLHAIGAAFDANDAQRAAPLVRQLMFVERFADEIERANAALETE